MIVRRVSDDLVERRPIGISDSAVDLYRSVPSKHSGVSSSVPCRPPAIYQTINSKSTEINRNSSVGRCLGGLAIQPLCAQIASRDRICGTMRWNVNIRFLKGHLQCGRKSGKTNNTTGRFICRLTGEEKQQWDDIPSAKRDPIMANAPLTQVSDTGPAKELDGQARRIWVPVIRALKFVVNLSRAVKMQQKLL